MKKEQISSCQDINWELVENLFAEMSGKKPEAKVEEYLPLLDDLPKIGDHVKDCEGCRETLVELRRKYGITRGIIFPKEGKEKQGR